MHACRKLTTDPAGSTVPGATAFSATASHPGFLAIAEAGKNQVLKSLLLIIVPDILSNYSIFKVCDTVSDKAVSEHRQMLEAIRNRDAAHATILMQDHLRGVMDFARALIQ